MSLATIAKENRPNTIFALSSGALPAAIAIIRVSGPAARDAFSLLRADRPDPRVPVVRKLHDPVDGGLIDEALCLWFTGPNSATGEDIAEFQCHGSRAVVARIAEIFGDHPDFREAEPGEFTRRGFANGRIDLNQADGLAELIEADDERTRKAAIGMYSGMFTRQIGDWTNRLLAISAQVEAELDFADEADVGSEDDAQGSGGALARVHDDTDRLLQEIEQLLSAPMIESISHGIRILIAGPPNSGKSTLLNALVGRDAAIVSDIEGTTRDVIDVPVRMGGKAFVLTDSAGLRQTTDDAIEAIGIERALSMVSLADILLWLGPEGDGPAHPCRIEVAAKSDSSDFSRKVGKDAILLSAHTGRGLDKLKRALIDKAQAILQVEDEFALNRRQHAALVQLGAHLRGAMDHSDLLVIGEELRQGRLILDKLTGLSATEDMLDALFGRFCIGK